MAKYNEIMDHVELSEEQRSKILSNVDRHFAKKKRQKQLRIWLPIVGVAAAAAVLLLVTKPWSGRTPVDTTETTETGGIIAGGTEATEQPGSTELIVGTGGVLPLDTTEQGTTELDVADPSGTFHMKEYTTAAELEAAAGFAVKDITNIPFEVTAKRYALIAGDIAEINCIGADRELCFRMTPGKEEKSGVYDEYPDRLTFQVKGCEITAKGTGDRCNLTTWTDGSYAYSIYADQGLSREEVQKLAEEIMN